MRYVEARAEEFSREETYRIFVTTSLQLAPQGKYVNKDYSTLVDSANVTERTGDEIAREIFDKAGLRFK